LKIGVPREYFVEGMDGEVKGKVLNAIKVLEGLGTQVEEISLPHTEYAVACYYLIATAEASSNLARYDGVRYGHRACETDGIVDMYMKTRQEGFGPEVKRRVMLGTYALSTGYYDAYYLKAQKVRSMMRRDFARAFGACDLILSPVAPTTAFRIGAQIDDPLQMYLNDIYTVSVNLAGIPSIVYGLFGLGMFVLFMGFGTSIIAGSLTLGIMTLPVVISASEEAILAVPQEFRVVSLSLGATKWQTIRHQVLPHALPGIITGIILGLGRAAGETAPQPPRKIRFIRPSER